MSKKLIFAAFWSISIGASAQTPTPPASQPLFVIQGYMGNTPGGVPQPFRQYTSGNCTWRLTATSYSVFLSGEITKENVPVYASATLMVAIAGFPNASNCPSKSPSNTTYNYYLVPNSARVNPETGAVSFTLECPRLPAGSIGEMVFQGSVVNGRLVGSMGYPFQGNGGIDGMTLPVQ